MTPKIIAKVVKADRLRRERDFMRPDRRRA